MYVVRTYTKDYLLLAEFQNASAVQAGFAISKSGTLTFKIPMSDAKCTDANLAFNNFVTVESNDIEPWDGYIVTTEEDGQYMVVTAYSMAQRLGTRRSGNVTFTNKTAGEIASRILDEANAVVYAGVGAGTIYADGPHYTLTYNYDNLYDRLTELADTAKMEFRVRRQQIGVWELDFVQKLGSDKTASVLLIYGLDIDGDPDYKKDMSTWANYITAFGKSPQSQSAGTSTTDTRPHVTYADWTYIGRDGLSQDTIENPDVSDIDTLRRLAKEEVEKRKRPIRTITFTLNRDRLKWGQFQDGDIIAIQLPLYDFKGIAVPLRVTGRDVSYDAATMSVTGTVLDGEAALLLDMYANALYQTQQEHAPTNSPADSNSG